MSRAAGLPADIEVFQRGWLSANNVLLRGRDGCALVDSGYVTHARQTLALVQRSLGTDPLDVLVNTHLHSDHCGGNAALQQAYPALETRIPPGQASNVSNWDPVALGYTPTGQNCPAFRFDALLMPDSEIDLGQRRWQIHSAPGHDPHLVLLYEPKLRLLISADALWENGFGVVFPELAGEPAFGEVERTLKLIQSLSPKIVIPGHGPIFSNLQSSLDIAWRRLDRFRSNPRQHAWHAAKVLVKFKLLEWRRITDDDLLAWAQTVSHLHVIRENHFSEETFSQWIGRIVDELEQAGAARREGEWVTDQSP